MRTWTVSPTISGYKLCTDTNAYHCIIGKAGLIDAANKREGDMATPVGTWTMRRVYFRPDKLAPPKTVLPVYPLMHNFGWCDDPEDRAYNQLVCRPYQARHEVLWRSDNRYDLLVVLGYNDAPPVPGLGSAIFFHLCAEDTKSTQGCVAVFQDCMTELLAAASPDLALRITY